MNDDQCNGQPVSCVSVRTGIFGSFTWVGNYAITTSHDNLVDPWEKIGDNANAYIDMIGTSAITNFTLPQNPGPAGSRIEGARIRIHHAEPSNAEGGQVSSYNLDVSTTGGTDTSDPDDTPAAFPTQTISGPDLYQPCIGPTFCWFPKDAAKKYSGLATYSFPTGSGMYTFGAVGDPATLTATQKSQQATPRLDTPYRTGGEQRDAQAHRVRCRLSSTLGH